MAKERKLDNWVTLFKLKNDSARNVDLPVVTAWKITSPITNPTMALRAQPVLDLGRHARATSSRTSTSA